MRIRQIEQLINASLGYKWQQWQPGGASPIDFLPFCKQHTVGSLRNPPHQTERLLPYTSGVDQQSEVSCVHIQPFRLSPTLAVLFGAYHYADKEVYICHLYLAENGEWVRYTQGDKRVADILMELQAIYVFTGTLPKQKEYVTLGVDE